MNNNSEVVQQWTMNHGGFQVCGKTFRHLPAGAYLARTDCYNNPLLVPRNLQLDDLIDFPDSLSDRVLREIDRFWDLGPRFRAYGFLHRRGYLFYGKQGGGKSSLVHQILARIVTVGHVAFFCENPYAFLRCMEAFRSVEPSRPMVCVFEDIDALIQDHGDSALLQWLDGNQQVDKAVNLATTNYPEKLDRRIMSRPRRFDRVIRIDAPTAALRSAYLARKVPGQSSSERERWVELTEGLSFAALAELIISVCCLGNDLDETVDLLKSLDVHNPSSSEFIPGGQVDEEFDDEAEPAYNGRGH